MLLRLKELVAFARERNYKMRELSDDERRYFMDTYRVLEEEKYEGIICKIEDDFEGLFDRVCGKLCGYAIAYRTENRKKVIYKVYLL